MEKKKEKFMVWIIWVAVFFLAVTVGGSYKLYHVSQELQEAQKNIELLNQQNQLAFANIQQTEYTQAIDFLENEIAKYREFIENQQNFLVWMVGLIGTGLIGVVTFLGIKTKKDITEITKETYEKQIRGELARMIGGPDKEKYLARSVEKEEKAKNKKILFVMQMEKDEILNKIYEILDVEGYDVTRIQVTDAENRAVETWTKNYQIVIYQINPKELEKDAAENVNHIKIVKACNKERVYGVLYCPTGRVDWEKCGVPNVYVSTANYGATAMERIQNLLYL